MGLRKGEHDIKFETHMKYWNQAEDVADIHICENVTEYELEAYKSRFLGPHWECHVAKVDPRLWGFGCSRPRVYGILWNTNHVKWDPQFPFMEVLMCLRAAPIMKAQDFFFQDRIPTPLTPGNEA